jgi:hypothetical protein
MNKHYLLLSAGLLLSGAAHAQGTELFFSEYDEGAHQNGQNYGGVINSTGNERALEVYNPTTSTVSLNPYSIRRYSNGSASPTEEERLVKGFGVTTTLPVNSMAPRSTFVLINGQASLPALTSQANQYSAGYQAASAPNVITGGGVTYFNGDDAMALVRYPSGTAGSGQGVIIDIVGVIGFQPAPSGTGGTGNWSGTNPLDGTPAVYVSSANQSLVRRPSVSTGLRASANPASSYNIADEWSVYSYAFPPGTTGSSSVGSQLYDQLGQHNDYTGPYGAYQTTLSNKLGKFDANISVYPNPAHGTATVEIKDAKVGSVTVMNNLGQRIGAQAKGTGQEKLTLDVSALKPGLYFVQIWSADGQTKIYKELVVQ